MLEEFDRQVNNLLQKGYPQAACISTGQFLTHIEPLRTRVEKLFAPEMDLVEGRLPFVIVVKGNLVATERAMSLVEREGKRGFVKLYPRQPDDFKVIDGVRVPAGMAYLLVDIDRGKANINIPPEVALTTIKEQARSPLTIDEGVAIVTNYPEFLVKNNCFSLLASRCGDKRVPAIWINRQGRPNLGWCWAGNPHTWLGSASCGSRVGISG